MKGGKHVIMVVDDDQDVLDGLRAILESGGYKMVEASSAEDAAKVFEDENPDLLIVDMMMEQIDSGLNFVKMVRDSGSKAPMYMLSSVGDELSKNISSSDLGVAGILQKPLDSEFILRVLEIQLH
ncbi:MAG: response regulator [Deltaproteobacteria bacterium]|uniref:Response regulator n=1 Tax=Candidatus Zymogenus saltonus TaxID=2844893 RepID=A0A9D8KE71_9DELT|nr:response regulator [Candidatus Zymogenus saltonus]